ncbi:hypothetical protein BGZ80_006173, partial [Entomortierella chlamydospora]
MSYSLSTSFAYAPDVVDFDAMNITETFPEASSFSFEMSGSYNHSYSDSISGIPAAQQALWDDGQLSFHHTINSSRVFGHSSALSSLNNSANNSMSIGHPPSRHLLAPPPQFHHRSLAQHHSSPLKGEYPYTDSENVSEGNSSHPYDEFEESSLQNSWIDYTKDQNGLMLLNDKEHQDEQHLLFLQDIGSSANVSHGDSISLFAKLADESNLSCDLFKEELDIDETRDQSRLQEQLAGSSDNPPLRTNTPGSLNNNGKAIGNEIFDKEFLASLKAPLVQHPPPPLPSSNRNILDGLHVIPAPSFDDQDTRKLTQSNSEQKGGNEEYKRALKDFQDSLKVADPIKTPHKFAPLPLPIFWNEPKIRPRGLPSFNLADYKDKAKTSVTAKSTNPLVNAVASADKQESYSSSPTTTYSVPDSSNPSAFSSAGEFLPTDIKSKTSPTPKTPTASSYLDNTNNSQYDREVGAQQQKQTSSPTTERTKKSTISNPHLAFDPTIPPPERADESKSTKGRSTLQQMTKNNVQQDDLEDEDLGTVRRSAPPSTGSERQGSISGASAPAMSPRIPVTRKRPSLRQ